MNKNNNIRGSVLIFILMAVALLGALTVVLSRTSSNTEETGITERSRVGASDIIRYASTIANAVNDLLLRGCSEREIDRERPSLAIPATSPQDGSCSVFRAGGTGVEYRYTLNQYRVPSPWPFPVSGTGTTAGQIQLMAQRVDGVGKTLAPPAGVNYDESLFVMTGLKLDVCLAINNILGITNPSGYPPRDTAGTALEGGNFVRSGAAEFINTTGNELRGKKAGCWVTNTHAGASSALNGTDYFYFYHVLIAR